jgi:phosphohistidine phosphatase
MSKTLYLLRHAKSSRDDSSCADVDRPLSPRGKRDALMLGRIFKNLDLQPAYIACSPSKRTKKTLKYISKIHDFTDTEITYRDGIYEASPQCLWSYITSLDERYDSAMIVGHNPWLTTLAHIFGAEVSELLPWWLCCICFNTESRVDISNQTITSSSYLDPKKIFAMIASHF